MTENEFLRLSDKFGRYCRLYKSMKSTDTPRSKADLKIIKH